MLRVFFVREVNCRAVLLKRVQTSERKLNICQPRKELVNVLGLSHGRENNHTKDSRG